MDFKEARKSLQNGARIRRALWDKSQYIKLVDGHVKSYKLLASHVPYESLDIILNDDWIIMLPDEERPATFDEMVVALSRGYKIKNSKWREDAYLVLHAGEKTPSLMKFEEITFQPTFDNFMATDWEIFAG